MWLRSDCVIEEHYGRCLVAKSKCALPLRSRRIRSRLNCIDAGSVKRLSRHKPLVACRQAPALFIPRPLDLGIKSAGDTLFLSLIRHPLLDKRGWSRDNCRNCISLYLARTGLLKFILVMDAIGTRQALEINGSTLHRRCGYGRTA